MNGAGARRASRAREGADSGLKQAALMLERTEGFTRDERRLMLGMLAARDGRNDQTWDVRASLLAELWQREFTWPEFDRWQAVFAATGTAPPLWDGLLRVPPRSAAGPIRTYRERKLFLLLDWLRALVARNETRTLLARYARLNVGARVVRQDPATGCPVCERVDRTVLPADEAALPPFHPGCRCLVLPALPARRDAGVG
jgi:hypothetical protein